MLGMRMLGVMGLALVMVSASATSASAVEWKAKEYPVIWEAKQIGNKKITIGNGVPVECEKVIEKSAAPELITGPTATLLFRVEYAGCKAFGFLSAEVTALNGFLLLLTWSGRNLNMAFKQSTGFTGAFGITVRITAIACEVTIPGPQEFTGGVVTAENNKPAEGEIEETFNVTKVTYSSNEKGVGCPKNGGEATLTGKMALKGFNDAGLPNPVKFE